MAVLYRHIRADKNEVFYVGIGKTGKRAYSIASRNDHWKKIVAKTTYEVEIILDDITYEEAKIKEVEFIKLYGRRDLGTGTLVNLTDGGDGTIGMSKQSRDKVTKAIKAWCNSDTGKLVLSEAGKKNKGKVRSELARENYSKSKKGIKHTDEHKRKNSESKKGRIAWNKNIGMTSEERKQYHKDYSKLYYQQNKAKWQKG